MEPTEEQAELVRAARNGTTNIIGNALAGTGKTTTLVMMLAFVPEMHKLFQKTAKQNILVLAFNTRIVKDMILKLEEFTKEYGIPTEHIEVRSINSCGHRAWGNTISAKLFIDTKHPKVKTLLRDFIKGNLKSEDASAAWDIFSELSDAVSKAKVYGYIPPGPHQHRKALISREAFYDKLDERLTPKEQWIVDNVLNESIKAALNGQIDFDDQIYMPCLFGGTFLRYSILAGDEAQDFNPINHAMLPNIIGDRFFAMGDRWQSIYAFRGAVQDSMQKLQKRFNMKECGLTNTFRCPEAVVAVARSRVPEYKSRKPGGTYAALTQLHSKDIPNDAAIICRNNAPLLKAAFNLLKTGRSVKVAGSEIGPKIIGIMKKLGSEDTAQEGVLYLIDDWLARKLETARDETTVNDLAECMRVFAMRGKNLGQAIAWGESLFMQDGTITLTTGHKAKGLEWDNVYFLNPSLIKRTEEQDLNLEYVIRTRAKEALYEVEDSTIAWE